VAVVVKDGASYADAVVQGVIRKLAAFYGSEWASLMFRIIGFNH